MPELVNASVTRSKNVDAPEARRMVRQHPFWYHTIDLMPGVVTPGWFDLRHALPRIPIPDVRGKRCLDIGTFDGFFAFELERRGAAEVVAIDIPDHVLWDWPLDVSPTGPEVHPAFHGFSKGDGFRIAKEITGSSARWLPMSIYDLDPADVGTFDVVICGSLLLHLRDPLRALAAVRRVCTEYFLTSEQIELWLSVLGRGRPLVRFNGSGPECQWWIPNGAAHRQMIYAAGFTVDQLSPPYLLEFAEYPRGRRTVRGWIDDMARSAITRTRNPGVLHRACLARPRP